MRLVLLLALCATSGCAIGLGKSLHQAGTLAQTDLTGEKKRRVEITETQNVILGFVFETDFADQARQKLLASCSGGSLENVEWRYSTDLGIFAYKNKLRLVADCVE